MKYTSILDAYKYVYIEGEQRHPVCVCEWDRDDMK